MRRIARPKVLILVILSAVIAALIASIVSQMQQLQVMNEAERREYLGGKLEGRITDEQIDRLAAAVSARLDSTEPAPEPEVAAEPEAEADTAEEPPAEA